MAKVQGQVFKVYDKSFSGRTLFSVKLENDPIYYRMGVNRGAGVVEPGNWIEFDAKPNADGKSAEITEAPVLMPRPVAPAAAPAAGPGNFGSPARETSIHYQSARKDALQFVQILVAAGGIALPAKASGKLEALEALVDHYTAQFFEDIGSGGAVLRASEAAPLKVGKKAAKGAALDSDDEDDGEDE